MTATATNDPQAEVADGEVPQIVALHSADLDKAAPQQRIPVFSIDGLEYTIPATVRTNQSLKYIHLARTRGQEIAMDYMLSVLLGDESYEALREFDDLTEEMLKDVVEKASKVMLGKVEAPKEQPRRGSRKSRG